jgi:hypothetical protein
MIYNFQAVYLAASYFFKQRNAIPMKSDYCPICKRADNQLNLENEVNSSYIKKLATLMMAINRSSSTITGKILDEDIIFKIYIIEGLQ